MRGGNWLRSRIRTHLAHWIPELSLVAWSLPVKFRPGIDKDARKLMKRANAAAFVNRKRQSATLYFNLNTLARDAADDQEIEEIVVHELVHVRADAKENDTNALARALVRARRGA